MVVMESFAELFDYNFSTIKDEMYAQYPREFDKFMRVESSTRPFERRNYLSGLGLPQRNRDGQPIPFQEPVKGYASTFIPVTYRLGYQIEKQAVEDELWNLLASRPRSMVYGSIVIRDMVAADILNNGFTLQGYDLGGTPLFDTAHTREDGGATWANQINEDQPITTETVFNAIATLLSLLQDSIGLNIGYTGTIYLYVPMINSELWQQALEVVKSVMNPGTSDNRINAALQAFNIVAVPLRYINNSDAWFIGWEPNTPNYGLTLIERVQPEISPLKPFGGNDDVWWSRLRMRFTAGYENKRGIGAVHAG